MNVHRLDKEEHGGDSVLQNLECDLDVASVWPVQDGPDGQSGGLGDQPTGRSGGDKVEGSQEVQICLCKLDHLVLFAVVSNQSNRGRHGSTLADRRASCGHRMGGRGSKVEPDKVRLGALFGLVE